MRALLNRSLAPEGQSLSLVERSRPEPNSGEVLVRVEVTGIQPADELMMSGRYYFERPAPFVPGMLGVGEVVAAGGGIMARLLRGRRVFFSSGYERDGAWAEYALADAATTLPIGALDGDAAVNMGNALTAAALTTAAREIGTKAVVVNAAAGNLGSLLAASARRKGLGTVALVRRASQAEQLRASGWSAVVDQSRPDFGSALEKAAAEHGAKVFVDSVGGGPAVTAMLSALPYGSTALVIGRLAQAPLSFDALPLLLGRALTLRAFGVNEWLATRSWPSKLRTMREARVLLDEGAGRAVARRVELEEVAADFAAVTQNPSEGKTLIYPQGVPEVV